MNLLITAIHGMTLIGGPAGRAGWRAVIANEKREFSAGWRAAQKTEGRAGGLQKGRSGGLRKRAGQAAKKSSPLAHPFPQPSLMCSPPVRLSVQPTGPSCSAAQWWSDKVFLLSDPILFVKNDIRIRSESGFGWNHVIHIRKLSKSVLWCTTYIFVICLFCLMRQNNFGVILPSAEDDWLK